MRYADRVFTKLCSDCPAVRVSPFSMALFLLVWLAGHSAYAQQAERVIKWSGDGLRLELAALSLDQIRAFFIGRGFSSTDADFIAQTGCVFRSAIGNAGMKTDAPKVALDLMQWRVWLTGSGKQIRTREDWAKIWAQRGAEEAATIAFHWALFPTRQEFAPTDYNWGMITFGLPSGTSFDLVVKWRTSGAEHVTRLEGLTCGK